jgi:diguanylate cyclase (GGDEF)-like protein
MLTLAPLLVVGIGALVALVLGPRRHKASREPWLMFAWAGGLFLLGTLVREWSQSRSGWVGFSGAIFTVPGYIIMIIALLVLVHGRRAISGEAGIDLSIIGLGAGLATVLLLAMPAAVLSNRPAGLGAIAAAYPLFDLVILLLLVGLAFATKVRNASFLLLGGFLVMLLAGDLAYDCYRAMGDVIVPDWADGPYVLAFAMIGLAALHPSMRTLGAASPVPVQAWSWPRVLLLAPAMLFPFALVAVRPLGDTGIVVALAGGVMLGLVILRAVRAVHDHESAQRRAEHRATHDELSGLPNRTMVVRHIRQRLKDGVRPGARLWLLFLDFDGFKLINEIWGHAAGDRVIAQVADRLRASVPERVLVARMGGDEFVVVEVCDEAAAISRVAGVLDLFAAPVSLGQEAETKVTASIGIAAADPGVDPAGAAEDLLREADTAMYRAKAAGPGRWAVFDAEMHQEVRVRVDTEHALRRALAEGDVYLAYQPIVDLRSGQLLGAEALARWRHPERGDVSPAEFVPVAEASGLIGPLGQQMIDGSLSQLAKWRRAGDVPDDFWLSVNLSAQQLRDGSLAEVVGASLRRHRVPADRIVLEITESVMIEPSAPADDMLFRLRGLGVRLVVDDFGTGYSALSYLRRYPVTGVKIDRSFTQKMGESRKDEDIVRAVVGLGEAMRLSVIAEGVETPEQRDVLDGLGVTLGQGYLWGRPEPPAEFGRHWSGRGPA